MRITLRTQITTRPGRCSAWCRHPSSPGSPTSSNDDFKDKQKLIDPASRRSHQRPIAKLLVLKINEPEPRSRRRPPRIRCLEVGLTTEAIETICSASCPIR